VGATEWIHTQCADNNNNKNNNIKNRTNVVKAYHNKNFTSLAWFEFIPNARDIKTLN